MDALELTDMIWCLLWLKKVRWTDDVMLFVRLIRVWKHRNRRMRVCVVIFFFCRVSRPGIEDGATTRLLRMFREESGMRKRSCTQP